jgi:hypothetical protein
MAARARLAAWAGTDTDAKRVDGQQEDQETIELESSPDLWIRFDLHP